MYYEQPQTVAKRPFRGHGSAGVLSLTTPKKHEMKRFVPILAAVTVALAPVASAAAQGLPTASDLVAKHVAAIGGKDAIMKIKSVHQKQTMEIPAAGLTAEMETFAAAPNKIMVKTTIPGIGEMNQGSDGKIAWDINPMQGSRLLEGSELEQTLSDADFYAGRLFSADKFKSMETVELTDFNNEKAYRVRMVRLNGDTVFTFFSSKDAFLIGTEATQESPMGRATTMTKLSGYQEFGGVKMASRTEMLMGPTSIVTTVTATTVNQVPDSAFDPPAEIKALIGKP